MVRLIIDERLKGKLMRVMRVVVCSVSASGYTFLNLEGLQMGSAASKTMTFPQSLSWSNIEDWAATNGEIDVLSWDFSVTYLEPSILLPFSMVVLKIFNFHETQQIDSTVWSNFISSVCRHMESHKNPYHNFFHVVDVFQATASILSKNNFDRWLTKDEMFCLLVSALVHDLDHPGTNNLYQVNSRTPLAIRYNDISVLENHHCASAFELLQDPSLNVFRCFSDSLERYQYARKIVIGNVLYTDMTNHFSLKNELDQVVARIKSADPASSISQEDKLILLKSILHIADISNPARKWETCKAWSDAVIKEFFDQGDREKLENLPVSANCDRSTTFQDELSVNFTDFIVAPFFFSLSKLCSLNNMCQQLAVNRTMWHDKIITRLTAGSLENKEEVIQKWEQRKTAFDDKLKDLSS